MRSNTKKKRSVLKKVLILVLVGIVLAVTWYHELVAYGLGQAKGQFLILWNAKPIEHVLQDPAFPDSLKAKIQLVQEIRQYAFDSIGLNHSNSYTSIFDQQGKPLLWVVTASEPFQLKAVEWQFPIIGSFSYKGFFGLNKAENEAAIWKEKGYDTSIDAVEGWSTLGWFSDPILSNMLNRNKGSLANLIIHELTHGTLYVKDNVDYNENLASFVGDIGAEMFLSYKYGDDSPELADYNKRKQVWKDYGELVLAGAERLDSLYATFTPEMPFQDKQILKDALINELRAGMIDFLSYLKGKDTRVFEELNDLNNTYFLDYRRYRKEQDVFEKEFREQFNSDFKKYFEYLKRTYPSL